MRVYANTLLQAAVHILSRRLKGDKIQWEEVKGIEWEAVGEKDGERGRGRVGVSGTWLSVQKKMSNANPKPESGLAR